MIIGDALAAIEVLLGTQRGRRVANALEQGALGAAHLLDIEVAQVLRRIEARRAGHLRRSARVATVHRARVGRRVGFRGPHQKADVRLFVPDVLMYTGAT